MDILRRPLGLTFTPEELATEKNDFLIGAIEHNTLVGCCVLTPKGNSVIQLRQMAVDTAVQAKGVGTLLIAYAEQLAVRKGFTTLMMHARKTAIGFYQKMGYEISSEEFEEVTIPHYEMKKQLDTAL